MNKLYTLLALALVIVGMASCSSSRNAQNTDDIYYSDGSKKAAAGSTAGGGASQGDYYSTAPSDNYVRMKATDPDRWSYFDDYDAYDSYYYSPMASASFGYGYPSYGLGFGSGLGYGYGLGFGYGYGMGFGYGMGLWDPYFAWNSWYNPYFYNPYYGGAVFVAAHGLPASTAYGMRPFNSTAYRNGLAQRNGATAGTRNNPLYRQGMSSTTAYNSHLSGTSNNNTFRNGNGNGNFRNGNSNQGYRPVNNNFGGQTRTYSAPSSFGGNSGGGFRSGGGGFRH